MGAGRFAVRTGKERLASRWRYSSIGHNPEERGHR